MPRSLASVSCYLDGASHSWAQPYDIRLQSHWLTYHQLLLVFVFQRQTLNYLRRIPCERDYCWFPYVYCIYIFHVIDRSSHDQIRLIGKRPSSQHCRLWTQYSFNQTWIVFSHSTKSRALLHLHRIFEEPPNLPFVNLIQSVSPISTPLRHSSNHSDIIVLTWILLSYLSKYGTYFWCPSTSMRAVSEATNTPMEHTTWVYSLVVLCHEVFHETVKVCWRQSDIQEADSRAPRQAGSQSN